MLELTLVALQDTFLEKMLDENRCKSLFSEFASIMQQGYAYLPPGIRVSSTSSPVSYDRAIAWFIHSEDDMEKLQQWNQEIVRLCRALNDVLDSMAKKGLTIVV